MRTNCFYAASGLWESFFCCSRSRRKRETGSLLGSRRSLPWQLFYFLRQDWTLGLLLAGVGCELGHMFPAFYGFKGGKGILCGGTLAWMLGWKVGLVAWGLFAALWLLSKYVSLGSIFAGVSLTVSVFLFYGHNLLYTALAFVISVLVVWCHRENINRLLHGTERKFKWHSGPPKE